jgi:tetratricopeptide (TPR) repeat protein
VQFRRAEYFFTRKKYLDAEQAYSAIVVMGESSEYYELALYKLGWTLYKQDFHEEALHKYMALLDYKVSVGYDFDQVQEEADERRVADTYRVISLSFSNLGGPDAVEDYFAVNGHRSYEDRIYSHLAEFYFEKLRYHDAAIVYKAFVRLNPLHQASPHFSMRVVEIYEAGGFPKLVLESKKDFASNYGLQSEYWRHFDAVSSPEVLNYLKANLTDLAQRYTQPIIVVEYSVPNIREINEIVRGLPNGKGLGAFIWEPTKWRGGALFDQQGSTRPAIDIYAEMAQEYGLIGP